MLDPFKIIIYLFFNSDFLKTSTLGLKLMKTEVFKIFSGTSLKELERIWEILFTNGFETLSDSPQPKMICWWIE